MNSSEIARLAHVSRSTVSRVVNRYPNVPPKTRQKVQKIIDEYGYTPNVSARVLAGKTNHIIGIFIADISIETQNTPWLGIRSPYNMELLASVIANCKKMGYLTLVDVITDLDECKQIENYFTNRMLYGGIFVGFPYRTKELESLAQKQNNVVLIDQLLPEDDKKNQFKIVNTDNFKGGYLATKHLIDKGHRNIAHITGDSRLSSIERQNGYISALKDAGIQKRNNWIIPGDFREKTAYKNMLDFLKTNQPTAIFSANDIMALGVARAIKESGLQVAKDISLIGFDDLKQSQWLDLQLTTVSANLEDIAAKSVQSLFGQSKEPKHTICDVTLIERKSVQAFL